MITADFTVNTRKFAAINFVYIQTVLTAPDEADFDKSPYFGARMVSIAFDAINMTPINVLFESDGKFRSGIGGGAMQSKTCGTVLIWDGDDRLLFKHFPYPRYRRVFYHWSIIASFPQRKPYFHRGAGGGG